MGYLRRILDCNPRLMALTKKLYGMGLYKCVNPFSPAPGLRYGAKKRLIVDMTILSNTDYGTGIQRVVKKLYERLNEASANQIDLVTAYATADRPGYYLAPRNASDQGPQFLRTRTPLVVKKGDVFLGLDFAPDVILAQRKTLRAMRELDMRLFFLVHDLLPVHRPDWFSTGTSDVHGAWLKKIAEFGEPVCVSGTVRQEFLDWLKARKLPRSEECLHWIHNGCDVDDFSPRGFFRRYIVPDRPFLLVVSTVEPRKGHDQILDAFEQLWRQGSDLALVIAGKEGWLVQKTADRIKLHPEAGKRLFWHEDLNDAELGLLYGRASGLLSASHAEGFGLSLVEGAAHGVPLLVRDLPVFREVAGNGAAYFSGVGGGDLAEAIMDWETRKKQGTAPDPAQVKVKSWRQSADMLMDILEKRTDLRFRRNRD